MRPVTTRTVAALLVAVSAAVVGAFIGEFPDLHVYRYAGEAVLEQHAVYASDDPVTGYPFTYPPFAAVLMPRSSSYDARWAARRPGGSSGW
jgi:hypothetical protein